MIREWLQARRERNRRIALEEQIRADSLERQVKRRKGITEGRIDEWDWLGPWRDVLLDRMFDPNFGGPPVASQQRKDGSDFPFFANEIQLGVLRDSSRLLCKTNSNAAGLLRGLRSYTIGTGATVRCVAKNEADQKFADTAQAECDHFIRINKFARRQKEFFTRSRRDGEGLFRLFPQPNGTCLLRFVWPEQLRQPPNYTLEEYAYGVRVDLDDMETATEYAIWPTTLDAGYEPEFVPADEVIAVHCNVDSGVRRGVPDFAFGVGDRLNSADKLLTNMGEGSALQAAIAYIRQHMNAPVETIRAFAADDADRTRSDPTTGKSKYLKKFEPGLIVDTGTNTNFLPSPYNAGIPGHLSVAQALIRSACANWNAPEWLGSSDASNNNFASSLTAESPFILGIKDEQETYCDAFRVLFERVLWFASQSGGRLPDDILDRLDVIVTLPDPTVRDPLQFAQANQIKIASGWKSPQMCADEEGIDYAQVVQDLQEVADAGLGMGGLLPIDPPAPNTPAAPGVPAPAA